MPSTRILIDGETIKLEEIARVARAEATIELSPAAVERVEASRALVERVAAGNEPVYGINTGFGTLAEVRIEKKDLRQLQCNLLRSHPARVGPPLSIPQCRRLPLLRRDALAQGLS